MTTPSKALMVFLLWLVSSFRPEEFPRLGWAPDIGRIFLTGVKSLALFTCVSKGTDYEGQLRVPVGGSGDWRGQGRQEKTPAEREYKTASLLLGEYTLISRVSDPDSWWVLPSLEKTLPALDWRWFFVSTKPKFCLGNPCSLKIGVGMVGRGALKEETSSLNLWVTSIS